MKLKSITNISAILSILIFWNNLNAQPAIEWEKNYGGSGSEIAYDVKQTEDGGYIVAGRSSSNDFDIIGNIGESDYWILKLDVTGNLEWKKNYGGTSLETAYSIEITEDDGYIIAGFTYSNDGNVNNNKGDSDYWIVKLDLSGNLEWERNYGGSKRDWARSIQQTSDGGYVIAGLTESNNGDVSNNNGDLDYWILKLDIFGNLEWEKNYGGSGMDIPYSIKETKDSGFIVIGQSSSNNGDVGSNNGDSDCWVLKLDAFGNLEWEKNYGGLQLDVGFSIQQTKDDGYILAGWSDSYSLNNDNYWILKLDVFGNLEWEKKYGGTAVDQAYSIRQTEDGGYVIAGFSESSNGDLMNNNGFSDYWILKLDVLGNIEWEKNYGGSKVEQALSIEQTNDGGYIVSGFSNSSDRDVENNLGSFDFWIVKLEAPACPIYNTDTQIGLILTKPDGTCYRITCEVNRGIVTETVDCP